MPLSVRTGPGSAATNVTRGARQAAEHLVGPDRVERGEAVVEEDRDVHVTGSFVLLAGLAGRALRATGA